MVLLNVHNVCDDVSIVQRSCLKPVYIALTGKMNKNVKFDGNICTHICDFKQILPVIKGRMAAKTFRIPPECSPFFFILKKIFHAEKMGFRVIPINGAFYSEEGTT